MDLSVIVVNWNTRDLLRACLQSAIDTIEGTDLSSEIIVVDNGSTDGSIEMVASAFPEVRLIVNQENLGFARANNRGIQESSGRYVLLLNSDAEIIGDATHQMISFLDDRPHLGAVGGMLRNPDGTFQSSYMDFPSLLEETLLLTGLSRWLLPPPYPSQREEQSQQVRNADWVSGAFLMMRRRTLDEIGLLDESYFMYTEEMDWCYRTRRGGWQVAYLPTAQAIHHGGGTSQRVPLPKRAQIYRSKWLFMCKHRGAMTATAFRMLVLLVSGLKLLAWSGAALQRDPVRRDLARQHVASYRFLLARFPGRLMRDVRCVASLMSRWMGASS